MQSQPPVQNLGPTTPPSGPLIPINTAAERHPNYIPPKNDPLANLFNGKIKQLEPQSGSVNKHGPKLSHKPPAPKSVTGPTVSYFAPSKRFGLPNSEINNSFGGINPYAFSLNDLANRAEELENAAKKAQVKANHAEEKAI